MADVKSPKPKIGNAELADKLAEYDYKKLQGDNWQSYLALTNGTLQNPKSPLESKKNQRIGGLAANDLYDYEGYRVSAIIEALYPEIQNSPTYASGIKLEKHDPEIANTRITAGRAKDLNSQVTNFSPVNPGLYYLLKKVAPAEKTEEKRAPGRPANN